MKKKILTRIALAGVAMLVLSGCPSAAETANKNLTKSADNFEVPRRIVGINGITDKVLFSVEGFCSYEIPENGTVEAICATKDSNRRDNVERTTLHLSDNVTFLVTQTGPVGVDFFRSRVIFRPETIVPNFDLSTSDNPSEPK